MFELRRYRGVVEEKLTLGSKNDMRNLVNLHFDVLLLPIAHKVSS